MPRLSAGNCKKLEFYDMLLENQWITLNIVNKNNEPTT